MQALAYQLPAFSAVRRLLRKSLRAKSYSPEARLFYRPRPLLKTIALSVSLLISLSVHETVANPISFTPNGISNGGSVKCEVKVPTLGQLPVKNGSAAINGRVITFKAGSDFTEEPRTVLIGSVLRSEANLSSSPPSITGLALFLMGDWIEQIDDPSTADIIFRSAGQTL
mgnify:FL=1